MADVIFLVRHGEADSNVRKYFGGFTDAPLTPLGIRQAAALKKRISHEDIGRAFSSDLSRARNTLAALSLDCPKEFSQSLREKNYGELEGVAWGVEEEKYAIHHEDPIFSAPGGENYIDVQRRTVEYFEKEIFPSKEKKILVVSHHGPIVLLACHILQIPLSNFRALRMGNCGLSIFTRENGMLRLKLWNSLSHFGLESYAPLFSSTEKLSAAQLCDECGGNPAVDTSNPKKKPL